MILLWIMGCNLSYQVLTHFYAQANGQEKISNKVLIGILEKMLVENPKDWHKILSETLWA